MESKLLLETLTVKQLINILLDKPMCDEIYFMQGQRKLRNIKICAKKPEGLGALFG